MTEELLAYLLDDLCPERRRVVEHNVEIDPAWRRELERLRQCLAAGGGREHCGCQDEAPPEDVAPPEDLLTRTCFLVEHSCDCHDDSPDARELARGRRGRPHAPTQRLMAVGAGLTSQSCGGPLARPWTLWDVGVGAGVLLALGALMTPALYETRATSRQLTCEDNLRVLGNALFTFQEHHQKLLPPVAPDQSANAFVIALRDGAGLSERELRQILICPESRLAAALGAGRVRFYFPSRAELQVAVASGQLPDLLRRVPSSYAYRVGYYDAADQYQQLPYTGDPHMAMLSDAPEVTPGRVRSSNHGCGQNVLYECLGVRYRSNCLADDNRDNLYLNQAGRHAAGNHQNDMVLISPLATPTGALTPVVYVK